MHNPFDPRGGTSWGPPTHDAYATAALPLPELVVGTAARHGAVTVLPLFPMAPAAPASGVAYRLGAHALASGRLQIRELGGGARVDRLEARNHGADRVLFIEGDHLIGSKQNRVITSSALIGGGGLTTLPVVCVEQGRWGVEAAFRSAASAAPASLRRILMQTVTSSLLDHRSRATDQGQIWSQIAEQQRRLRVTSATSALEASYCARAADLRTIAARLPYAPRATGLAIAIGRELVSIDLFDQPQTCEAYWRQLVDGATLEALGGAQGGGGGGGGDAGAGAGVGQADVEALVARLGGAEWRRVPPVGEGEELRARAGEVSASALIAEGRVIHLGAAVAPALESPRRSMRRELPPELADRYRIIERLGVGGVKEVFRAADRRGGPDVAIARVPYASRARIASEADLARRVEGPYVPQIHEAFIDALEDGYIVMELCVGPSLAEVARRPLTVAEAGPILVELARALRAIHAACVLHRDVKPENVLLCPTPGGVQLKLIDFGLSAEAVNDSSAVFNLRELSGTLPYMAREALRGTDVDGRTDVFALGVCAFRLLTGEVPVLPDQGESDFDYLHRLSRLDEQGAAWVARLQLLPEPAAAMLARMLSSERERRPFMPEVVEAFERAFGAGPIALPELARAWPPPVPGAAARERGAGAGGSETAVGSASSSAAAASASSSSSAASAAPASAGATGSASPSSAVSAFGAAARSATWTARSSWLRRPALERARQIPLSLEAPEHLLVTACAVAPLIALAPEAGATVIRALDGAGRVQWSRDVDARLTAGLRADLDGDGARELYLAGPDLVVCVGRDGEVRYARRPRAASAVPTLAALPGPEPALLVDGEALEPRTGLPRRAAIRAYEGDGRQLIAAADLRGASYHGAARQAFRGAHGTAAAVMIHAHDRGFHVAHLEEERGGRAVQLVVYGPGGGRVLAARVQHCEVRTGDGEAIARLASGGRRLFGPEHAPLAVLAPDGGAAVIAPLLGADPALPPVLAAYALRGGHALWRLPLPAGRARAVLGDVDGDGRPELVVGTGDAVLALDPWTGEVRMELPCAGAPVAIGDPFGSGATHLVTVSDAGVELWRGPACAPGALAWAGPRGDLWRTGTVDARGLPVGPI